MFEVPAAVALLLLVRLWRVYALGLAGTGALLMQLLSLPLYAGFNRYVVGARPGHGEVQLIHSTRRYLGSIRPRRARATSRLACRSARPAPMLNAGGGRDDSAVVKMHRLYPGRHRHSRRQWIQPRPVMDRQIS